MARPLGRDHEHVEVGPRLDELEVDIEAVREGYRRAFLGVALKMVVVEIGLQLVGRQHHHDVGPRRRLGNADHAQARAARLVGARRALAERDRHLRDAALLEVVGVGMALAAVTHDRHLFRLDEVHVRIAIVIDTHLFPPSC